MRLTLKELAEKYRAAESRYNEAREQYRQTVKTLTAELVETADITIGSRVQTKTNYWAKDTVLMQVDAMHFSPTLGGLFIHYSGRIMLKDGVTVGKRKTSHRVEIDES